MRTFLISIITFSLMLALIITAMLFIHRVTKEMEDQILSMPACDKARDALKALEESWHRWEWLISLSSPADRAWEIQDLLDELKIAVQLQDDEDFQKALQLLQGKIARVRQAEQLSLSNLF